MPNAAFTEIVTTTLQNYSGEIADNVTKTNALLNRLEQKGQIKTAGGRTIVQEIEYAENSTVAWYSGYDVISTNTAQILTAAEFDWKQIAGTIKYSGLEVDVQNIGADAIHNLIEARMSNLKKSLRNTVAIGVYADGTGSSGKEFGGLQLLVEDAPSTGSTIGGISRGTDTWWRNQMIDGSTSAGATMDKTNINHPMNALWLTCVRGPDKPDLIMADGLFFAMYWEFLQEKQRITDVGQAQVGYSSLKYMGADVVFDSLAPASHMYFLNTDYLYLRTAKNRWFVPIDKRMPSDVGGGTVDAIVTPMVAAGNLTMSNASLQGVLVA